MGAGLTLFLQLIPHNTTELLLVALPIPIFVGLTIANAATLVSLSAGPEIQGEILGIESSVQALAQSIPAIISGYIATMGINMPVIVGGCVILVGAFTFIGFYRPSKHVLHVEEADELAAAST